MDKKSLIDFLIKSKMTGYAAGNSLKESDGSYSTRFEDGDFKIHDNWFGGEPFGGREVVFYKNEPYWMMVYYGADFSGNNSAIPTLRKALSQMPEDFPTRGPVILEDGDCRYENKWEGDVQKFSGEEIILKNGKEIYRAKYSGGLVDQLKD